MTIKELKEKIDEIIKSSPYTKEQIAKLWEAEDEQWEPETIFALSAAYEYYSKINNQKEAEFLRGKYLRELALLKEKYLTPKP